MVTDFPVPMSLTKLSLARNNLIISHQQCSGSGSESGSGSTCFWASRIRIHLSEVWIRNRLRILLSSCKNSKKNLDSYYFVTLFDFLSLKNYVNVPSDSNKQKNVFKKIVFVGILKVNDEKSRIRIQDPDPGSGSGSRSISHRHGSADPDPDPLQNVMDLELCPPGRVWLVTSRLGVGKSVIFFCSV
jgi:hypothetical protein